MNFLNSLEERDVKKPTTFVSILTIKKLIDCGMNLDGFNLYVDGNTLSLLYKIKYGKKINRYNFDMSGIALEILNNFSKEGPILFYGGTQSDADSAQEKLRSIFPKNQSNIIVINGYEKTEYMLDQIEILNPICIILSLGSSYQEVFSLELKNKFGSRFQIFTSGAFITQLAKSKEREYYPNWAITLNIRWIYRCFRERGHINRIIDGIFTIPFALKHL